MTVGWDDVYVMLLEWSDAGDAHLRVFVNPLVPWIWGGGAVYLVGMFILFLPAPRPRPVSVRVPAREGPHSAPAD
jgi:cytochrome c-type biogenesis protein CcmF